MVLYRTTNKITGRTTYFIDGKRVSEEAYVNMEIRANMANAQTHSITSHVTKLHVRHSKCIDFNQEKRNV